MSITQLPRPDTGQVDVAAAELGRALFFDPVLSGNYKRSCASCHRPQKAFTDQRIVARAYSFAQNLPTHTPTLLGATRQTQFFHDGRANSLDAVIELVLTNPHELNSSYEQATQRLMSSDAYRQWFGRVFGHEPSAQTINQALVAYLKQLDNVPSQTASATDTTSYVAERRVFAQAGCGNCHPGPDLRDGRRHKVAPNRWVRTPTLRYLALTPPYLSDGSAPTLTDALNSPFHARHTPTLTPHEKQQLVTYLTNLPADTALLSRMTPIYLPAIPGAPNRRIGGTY